MYIQSLSFDNINDPNASWNPQQWNSDIWISLHGPILLSGFFNIICILHFYKLWKLRKNESITQHLRVRHTKLFYSHMLINYYWISIHPSLLFVLIIIRLHPPLLFCFTYLIISIKLLIWCNRMWILYWKYSFSSMQIRMLWKQHLNAKYYSFMLKYPQLGRLNYTLPLTSLLMLIFDLFLFWIAYETDFHHPFHLSIAFYFVLWVLFLNILCIRLHRKHNMDNFKIRSEFTWFCLLFSADFAILIIPYFVVTNEVIRIWIIIDGVALCNLMMIVITVNLIINNSKDATTPLPSNNNNNSATIGDIIDLLKNPVGINAFAEWLVGEFNVESLLFVIEVRTYLFNCVTIIYMYYEPQSI